MNLNKLLTIGATILLAGLGVVSSSAQPGATDRDRLLGAWRLVELDQPGPGGKLMQVDCSGQFVFTRDGHLSVQVMDREPAQSAAGANQYAQNGYEATYGSYVVDEPAHTFTFHVEGALVRTLVGKDLPRRYELTGNRLIVTSTRPEEHWRAIWNRY